MSAPAAEDDNWQEDDDFDAGGLSAREDDDEEEEEDISTASNHSRKLTGPGERGSFGSFVQLIHSSFMFPL